MLHICVYVCVLNNWYLGSIPAAVGLFLPACLSSCVFPTVSQAKGEAAGEDVDSDSDSDDDDDDVRVTIGDIKTGAPQYT